MRLSFNENSCRQCTQKNCLQNCPNLLNDTKAFNCIHCPPAKAACLLACKRNAIVEAAKGILSIDRSQCNSCGACIEACEKKAIVLANGRAAKCDLCAKRGFAISCVQACEQNAVFVLPQGREQKQISQLVGWRINKNLEKQKNKQLKESNGFEIIEARDNEKKYLLKGIPDFSLQEAELFHSVLQSFQSGNGKSRGIESELEKYCAERMIELDAEQKGYLLEQLEASAFAFGPMTKLLENDRLEEIAIIGIGKNKPVFVFDRVFGWLATNLHYCSEKEVKNLANKMSQKLGRRLTMQTPKLNAVLEDGSRMNAVIEPVAFTGPSITIRKFRQEPFTPLDLIENNTASAEAMAFLWMAMQTDCSLLIAGNTGSGKTSTLNALFCFVPKNERIIAVEETPEINLPHSHLVKMNVADNLGIGMKQLIVETLRMRPDRIIVGEIRNSQETLAFIDTLLAGQGKGSYATFHAQSAAETMLRLKNLGVNEFDLNSIDLVIVQRRWNKIDAKNNIGIEQRRITEISEVCREKEKASLNCLFEFNYKKNALEKKGKSKTVIKKIERCFGMEKKEIARELEKRAQALKEIAREKPVLKEFFEKVNSHG